MSSQAQQRLLAAFLTACGLAALCSPAAWPGLVAGAVVGLVGLLLAGFV
jgi:hypothetical protein